MEAAWSPPAQSFDHASSCARSQRSSRARGLHDAPCDLTRHPYCNTPGTHYPWHAIRRFVKENQGLMRRMYGNERHISVLKAELENYIEQEEEDIMKATLMYTKTTHGRAMKDRPHFRPIQNDRNKKNETLSVRPLQNVNEDKANVTESSTKIEISNETVNDDKGITYKTKLESIANIEINHLDPDVITLDAVIKQSIETNSIYPKSSDANIEALVPKNSTDKNSTTTTENSNAETTTDVSDDSTTEAGKEAFKHRDSSTLPPTLLFSEKIKVDRVDTKVNEKKEELNACESREIIDAPFWANSTRGEVLVLLNMWPYEQFIHQEMCVHERKQMYCREGCRCEQQYRLHRLLAYDPRNECRGIFADWFRFPACCTCRCYDVPVEFRARSPRILRPQYDEHIKRVLYEDVARDWYAASVFDDEGDEDMF
ncbi:Spatzle-like protein [Operophtera brumata]|uniref:Spatzle-like protein n=1 Tax=Operophtera brumata TaxID=104452 RepID=A0A0L7LGW4_OPEBR|nr:Spatzle-like protein [Operophtera brumata]